MAQPPVQPPDDPALRAALRRALGTEHAPAALRVRIQALASNAGVATATDQPTDQPLRLPAPRRGPLYKLAMAAVLLICFGGAAFQIWRINQPPKYDATYAIPNSVYKAMADAHTARAAQQSPDTVTTLATATDLAKQLGRPVFVPDLTRDGWTFQGGAVRAAAGKQVPQLFYTKGDQSLSAFSFPADVAQTQDGTDYETTFNNHPIAGFTKKGGLFCIVGDKSLPLPDLRTLLDQHRDEIRG
jgi:hypothetical protein